RDREPLLRLLLPDHILVEERLDLDGHGKAHPAFLVLRLLLLGDDVQADVDALVADVDGRPGDQLADVTLALVAERALQPVAIDLFPRHQLLSWMTWSTRPYSRA